MKCELVDGGVDLYFECQQIFLELDIFCVECSTFFLERVICRVKIFYLVVLFKKYVGWSEFVSVKEFE